MKNFRDYRMQEKQSRPVAGPYHYRHRAGEKPCFSCNPKGRATPLIWVCTIDADVLHTVHEAGAWLWSHEGDGPGYVMATWEDDDPDDLFGDCDDD